jgi:hypothetical protein
VNPDPDWIRIHWIFGSGFGIRIRILIRIEQKCWIRIKSIRIHNPAKIKNKNKTMQPLTRNNSNKPVKIFLKKFDLRTGTGTRLWEFILTDGI